MATPTMSSSVSGVRQRVISGGRRPRPPGNPYRRAGTRPLRGEATEVLHEEGVQVPGSESRLTSASRRPSALGGLSSVMWASRSKRAASASAMAWWWRLEANLGEDLGGGVERALDAALAAHLALTAH